MLGTTGKKHESVDHVTDKYIKLKKSPLPMLITSCASPTGS